MAMYNFTPKTTNASKPLTLDGCYTFVLVPYIAASLIAKDKDTNFEGGWEIMQQEGNHGDDDPDLDAVFATNVKRCKLMVTGGGENQKDKGAKGKSKRARPTNPNANKENTKPVVRHFMFSLFII
jgi:hypothetical protein